MNVAVENLSDSPQAAEDWVRLEPDMYIAPCLHASPLEVVVQSPSVSLPNQPGPGLRRRACVLCKEANMGSTFKGPKRLWSGRD